ncbi:UNVERIFIED_CONTAM: hypothetical protein PYX00_009101 [Menopon gallinae]|uniref:Max-binding protein MNT n=1 Tax=Menopon gallinae TaxID=328185 RepID=A0AAW2HAD1_9NEOP
MVMGVIIVDKPQEHGVTGKCWRSPPPKKKWIRHYMSEEYSGVAIKQEPVAPFLRNPATEKPRNNAVPREGDPDYHHSYHRESSKEQEDLHDLRRRTGAGTREVHNKLEKNRRAHLKECFELVKKQLPPSQDDKKASNLNILHSAIRFIQSLRRKEREYEHEMERLAREKIALQQRFATLKKELAAQWDHIDFNKLVPDLVVVETAPGTHSTANQDQEETMPAADNEDVLQRRSLVFGRTSPATTSASPLLSHAPVSSEERHSPRSGDSPKHVASREQEVPKLISIPGRRESPKRSTATSPHAKPAPAPIPSQTSGPHLQLPVSTPILSTAPGHIAATIVSPAIQLVTSSGIRMLPGDQPLALSLSHPPSVTSSSVALVHKPSGGDSPPEGALGLIQTNGIRGKGHPIGLAIQNGALAPGLTAKNGTIYKQQAQVSEGASILPTHLTSAGITHMVASIPGSHGTLVTPVPVTVVSQGNQVAHILTASQQLGGKVMTPLSLKPVSSMPMMSQYIVKQGAAMVVVSQPSTVPPHSTV